MSSLYSKSVPEMQTVHLKLPRGLLARLDACIEHEYTTRSEFIRQAIVQKIQPPALQTDVGIFLLTDHQLQELQSALMVERRRRREAKRR